MAENSYPEVLVFSRFFLSLMTLALASAPSIPGQELGYHSELVHATGDQSGRAWVVVVNDSDVAIEAFHIKVTLCHGFSESSYDFLGHSGGSTDSYISYPPGTQPAGTIRQRDIIEPGGKMVSMTNVPPEQDGCSAKGKIDTVLFSDGTFKGDQNVIRAIQARRDGVAAALEYWLARAHREDAEHSIPALAKEAKTQLDKHKGKACMGPDHSAGCEFWSGAVQVEMSLAYAGFNSRFDANENYRRYVSQLDGWQNKIDSDESFQKLKVTFPLSKNYP